MHAQKGLQPRIVLSDPQPASQMFQRLLHPRQFLQTLHPRPLQFTQKQKALSAARLRHHYDMDIKNAVEMEANLFGVVNDTHDKKEGMGAFLEKRAANLTDF